MDSLSFSIPQEKGNQPQREEEQKQQQNPSSNEKGKQQREGQYTDTSKEYTACKEINPSKEERYSQQTYVEGGNLGWI